MSRAAMLQRSNTRKKRGLSQKAQERLAGLFFASPWLLHILLLTAIPLLASLYFSFCDYQIVKPPIFWGLRNYRTLFTNDRLFLKSLGNTAFMVLFGVPVGMVAGLGIGVDVALRGRPIRLAVAAIIKQQDVSIQTQDKLGSLESV